MHCFVPLFLNGPNFYNVFSKLFTNQKLVGISPRYPPSGLQAGCIAASTFNPYSSPTTVLQEVLKASRQDLVSLTIYDLGSFEGLHQEQNFPCIRKPFLRRQLRYKLACVEMRITPQPLTDTEIYLASSYLTLRIRFVNVFPACCSLFGIVSRCRSRASIDTPAQLRRVSLL